MRGHALITEIEYAGLLHDFGKVGVREEVLVKAKKLYPHQRALIMARFEHAATALQIEVLSAQLAALRAGDPEPLDIVEATKAKREQLDTMLQDILVANEPSVLPRSVHEALQTVAQARYTDPSGNALQLLAPDELDALLVQRGSLTQSERLEIESHVTHTYNFLVRIPWGHALRRVPEIAAKHHEYLDGSGYPAAIDSGTIPLQARMMTVADIFDALTAADRPYKKAVPVPKALDILRSEVNRGRVDGDVVDLFVDAKVWQAKTEGAQ